MENQNVLEIISQIFPFVGSQDSHGEAEEGPNMNHLISGTVMLTEFMNLGVTIMAAGHAVTRAGGLYLVVL
jgi:hypothetical protein